MVMKRDGKLVTFLRVVIFHFIYLLVIFLEADGAPVCKKASMKATQAMAKHELKKSLSFNIRICSLYIYMVNGTFQSFSNPYIDGV